MIIRSKAPLRLGLAGGGSDVSPYSDIYGGLILNATINLYAYCTIEETDDNQITINAFDAHCSKSYSMAESLEIDGEASLIKGVYNRVVKDFGVGAKSFKITTYNDAPAGSGLGTSSTMVVCILKAFVEWLGLPLGDYEISRLAYEIERKDLGLSGGKQDQYAATFGGFNFIEFEKDDRVIVNPLRIKNWIKNELENSLILYYTGTSRDSAKIIDEQIKSTKEKNSNSLEGMHTLKREAYVMKECILKGDFDGFAACLQRGWEAKKKTASVISNPFIDGMYRFVMENGAKAAKISGAGGGGFMMIYCDPVQRFSLVEKLKKTQGTVMLTSFTERGTQAWTLY